jgi:putative PIN family toxin of toxin-antitoxin system
VTPTIVVDTNVLVSAFVARHPTAPPVRVLRAVRLNECALLLSAELVAEYRNVLLRPRIAVAHKLDRRTVDVLLTGLMEGSELLDPPRSSTAAPDPADQHLWDLVAAVPDAFLVTGDHALLRSAEFPGRVVSPRDFLEHHLP